MLKAMLRYVPLVPLCAAVLLFLLMPFDERAGEKGGEFVKDPRPIDQLDV